MKKWFVFRKKINQLGKESGHPKRQLSLALLGSKSPEHEVEWVHKEDRSVDIIKSFISIGARLGEANTSFCMWHCPEVIYFAFNDAYSSTLAIQMTVGSELDSSSLRTLK